jgi:putative transposase
MPRGGEAAKRDPSLDQGTQYTSIAFGMRRKDVGGAVDGSVGDAYDNASCESSSAAHERELLDRQASGRKPRLVQRPDFIEVFCNPRRGTRPSGAAVRSTSTRPQ